MSENLVFFLILILHSQINIVPLRTYQKIKERKNERKTNLAGGRDGHCHTHRL